MTTYIIRRLILGVVILILVTLIVFFAMRLLPGDPLVIFLGQQATSGSLSDEALETLRHQYGLDRPVMIQYFSWLGGIFTGNLGTSIYYHENVGSLLGQRFPVTLYLGIVAFVISNFFGVFLGLLAGIRRGTWIDTVATTLANVGITIPIFWLGVLLIYTIGLKLRWIVPFLGYVPPTEDFWQSIKLIIMPVICLAITGMAFTARQTRSSVLEVISQDYIRTAWSKGLRERAVILKHALKNSLIPVITLMGIGLGMVFGGSVLIETVFAIPGIGRLLVTSVFAQDYIVVQSGTLVIAFIIIISNLLVDISYGWLDPRIRYG
ncbi:MAG: peptide ABC transporter [Chloroflexi bacterium RBG_13_57_8]|nr:MAG: peptide ABC transporter [Chloroflexi bacterium RBG_13_57_8]